MLRIGCNRTTRSAAGSATHLDRPFTARQATVFPRNGCGDQQHQLLFILAGDRQQLT
jgi:hypothetical protein